MSEQEVIMSGSNQPAESSANSHPQNHTTRRGLGYMAVGGVMISFSSIFVKLSHAGPTTDGVYRMMIGGVILLVMALWRREPLWAGRRYFFLTLVSSWAIATDINFWHRAIEMVGPGLATLLVNLQVFFMIGIGILVYKERPDWKIFIAGPMALVGLYLIVGVDWSQTSSQYHLGIYFALFAAAAYTLFILLLRHSQMLPNALPAIANLANVSLLSGGILIIYALLEGESLVLTTVGDVVCLAAYGIAGQVLGWQAITRGLPLLGVALAGFMLLLQPILAFLWDILFFHRPTTLLDVFGVLLTLAAIYLASLCYSQSP